MWTSAHSMALWWSLLLGRYLQGLLTPIDRLVRTQWLMCTLETQKHEKNLDPSSHSPNNHTVNSWYRQGNIMNGRLFSLWSSTPLSWQQHWFCSASAEVMHFHESGQKIVWNERPECLDWDIFVEIWTELHPKPPPNLGLKNLISCYLCPDWKSDKWWKQKSKLVI